MRQSKRQKRSPSVDEVPSSVTLTTETNAIYFLPGPGSPVVELLQQFTPWLAQRLAALGPLSKLECALPTGCEGQPEYLGALQALLQALAGAPLSEFKLSCGLGRAQKLDARLIQLPRLQDLVLCLGSPSTLLSAGNATNTPVASAAPAGLPSLGGSLQQLAGLRSLRLVGCDAHAELPASLAELALEGAACISGLCHLDCLTSLTIVSAHCPSKLSPSIRALTLGPHCTTAAGTPGGAAELAAVLRSVPQLYSLRLVGDSGDDSWRSAACGEGPVPSLGHRLELSALAHLSALTSLELHCCGLDGDVEAGLEALQGLQRLCLEGCHCLAGAGLGLPLLPALKALTLSKTNLAHACICHLEALETVSVTSNRRLVSLVMRGLPSLRHAVLSRLPKLEASSMFLDVPKSTTLAINTGPESCYSDSDSEGWSSGNCAGGSSASEGGCSGCNGEGSDCEEYGSEERKGAGEARKEGSKDPVKRLLHF